ncbi:MAG: hypothetical protein NTV43_00590 [Methylococcales bacterium]|nr:hypothetical protein [Methylococcales bacterium]
MSNDKTAAAKLQIHATIGIRIHIAIGITLSYKSMPQSVSESTLLLELP